MAVPLLPVLNFGASALFNLAARNRQIIDRQGELVGEPEAVLSARGVFYRVELSPRMGRAMYAIDELNRPLPVVAPFPKAEANRSPESLGTGEDSQQTQEYLQANQETINAITNSAIDNFVRTASWDKTPILITGIQIVQSDIVSAMPCLDNFKVFYTFGQNFGQSIITGEMLLGPHGELQEKGIDFITSFFAKWRVSVSGRAIKLSVVNKTYLVYLTGLQLGAINPEFHILPFTLSGVLIDPENEKSGTLNTAAKIQNDRSLPTLLRALRAYPAANLTVETVSAENKAVTEGVSKVWDKTTPPTFEYKIAGTETESGARLSSTIYGDEESKRIDRWVADTNVAQGVAVSVPDTAPVTSTLSATPAGASVTNTVTTVTAPTMGYSPPLDAQGRPIVFRSDKVWAPIDASGNPIPVVRGNIVEADNKGINPLADLTPDQRWNGVYKPAYYKTPPEVENKP